MAIWPPDPDALRRPAWRSLAEAVEAAIDAGELAPGHRMPTHRRLAEELGLGTQTVGRAYEELTRRGRVRGEVGRGTFVAPAHAEARTPFARDRTAPDVVDLSLLKPVPDAAQDAALRDALRRAAADLPTGGGLVVPPLHGASRRRGRGAALAVAVRARARAPGRAAD